MYKYWVKITVVNLCQTAFKSRKLFQDVLCFRDYAKGVVASFPHQIQSEYYGVNISVSRLGPAQDAPYALPLWYVSEAIYLS